MNVWKNNHSRQSFDDVDDAPTFERRENYSPDFEGIESFICSS
jgi:hypothetical protein